MPIPWLLPTSCGWPSFSYFGRESTPMQVLPHTHFVSPTSSCGILQHSWTPSPPPPKFSTKLHLSPLHLTNKKTATATNASAMVEPHTLLRAPSAALSDASSTYAHSMLLPTHISAAPAPTSFPYLLQSSPTCSGKLLLLCLPPLSLLPI